jgi:hypothetical protein
MPEGAGGREEEGQEFSKGISPIPPELTYQGAIGAVAHCLARLIWKILLDGVSYLAQGQDTHPRPKKRRAQNLAQALLETGA